MLHVVQLDGNSDPLNVNGLNEAISPRVSTAMLESYCFMTQHKILHIWLHAANAFVFSEFLYITF